MANILKFNFFFPKSKFFNENSDVFSGGTHKNLIFFGNNLFFRFFKKIYTKFGFFFRGSVPRSPSARRGFQKPLGHPAGPSDIRSGRRARRVALGIDLDQVQVLHACLLQGFTKWLMHLHHALWLDSHYSRTKAVASCTQGVQQGADLCVCLQTSQWYACILHS